MSKPPIEPRNLSPRDAARRAGVSRSRIYELFTSGDIDALKDGSRTLVPIASIDAWLARLKPWGRSVGQLLPPEDRKLALERAGDPDFAGVFADHLQRLVPGLGEPEARTRALASTIRAYRRYHECDFKTARITVLALLEPPSEEHQQVASEPALARLYAERLKLLRCDVDEPEAKSRAFQYAVSVCCKHHNCDLENAKAMVRAAIVGATS
jgi:excisionase family DNA binding protein